jgi:hypothetical protein
LIEIRTHLDASEYHQPVISKEDAQRTIRNNKRTKDRYDELIMDIGKSFRKQIKG